MVLTGERLRINGGERGLQLRAETRLVSGLLAAKKRTEAREGSGEVARGRVGNGEEKMKRVGLVAGCWSRREKGNG